MNTYFISDAHLGSRIIADRRAHEQKLVDFLDRIKYDAEAIYFMGDMFDFWFEYKWVVPKGHVRFLGKLAELSDAGIQLHYFIGNHDIWTFGYLEQEIGMSVHRTAKHLSINGKTCFLAHGDGLYTKEKGFLFIRKIFHSSFCQALFSTIPPRWGLRFGYAWSESSRKKVLHRVNKYKGENKEELVLFAKEQEQTTHSDFYIFGHRHIMLDLQLATKSRIIILGDFIEYFSYAILNKQGDLILEQID